MNYYPIVRIPNSITNIEKEEIPLPAKPVEPKEPTKESTGGWNFFIVLIPLILIEFYFGASMEVVLATFLIGCLLILILSININIKNSDKYILDKIKYEKSIKNYEGQLLKYQKIVKQIRNDEDTLYYRLNRIKDEIKKTIYPLKKDINSKRGVTEDYFHLFLIDRFPSNIFQDYILEFFNTNNAYRPDFIFQDSKTGLHIDIEIDEPYSLNPKTPIHYISDGVHQDWQRDKYFLEKNWIIIRFAEEQIIRYPEACCDLIANTIFNLTGDKRWKGNLNSNLPKMEMWNYYDSLIYMEMDYRQSYLKHRKNAPLPNVSILKEPEIKLRDDSIIEDELPF